jgi:hypothetical protein
MVRQIINVLAFAGMVTVNVLANALPLNGQLTGEISDRFPVFFTPAAYVFGIWGVIYALLAAFVVYQALPRQRENPQLRRIGYLFALSCLANAAWIFCWHYNLFPLSLLVMLALLGLLVLIYLQLGIGRERAAGVERWVVHLPFSVYLGWISVATIANASAVLYDLGWNGQPLAPEWWAVIMIGVGVVLTLLMLFRRSDIAFALVIIWAYTGIVVRQADMPPVAIGAAAGALVVAVFAIASGWRRGLGPLPQERPSG